MNTSRIATVQVTNLKTGLYSTLSFNMLQLEQHGPLLIVRINRPAKKNAFNRMVYYELMRVMYLVRYECTINMIVLTAAGNDYFSAGGDLLQSQAYPSEEAFQRSSTPVFRQLARSIIYCPKVLVALVNGPCLGVACTLLGLFDIVYCTETARFETPFSKIGICAEGGSSYTFPRIMNKSVASEMLLFGMPLTAEEALRTGYVARIYKSDELKTVFWPQMSKFAALPTESLRASKRLLREPDRAAVMCVINEELKELAILRTKPAYKNAMKEFKQRKSNNSTKHNGNKISKL